VNTGLIIAIIVVAGLALVGFWLWNRQREQAALREHFGPEYERTVRELGTPRQATDELAARRRHVEIYINYKKV